MPVARCLPPHTEYDLLLENGVPGDLSCPVAHMP